MQILKRLKECLSRSHHAGTRRVERRTLKRLEFGRSNTADLYREEQLDCAEQLQVQQSKQAGGEWAFMDHSLLTKSERLVKTDMLCLKIGSDTRYVSDLIFPHPSPLCKHSFVGTCGPSIWSWMPTQTTEGPPLHIAYGKRPALCMFFLSVYSYKYSRMRKELECFHVLDAFPLPLALIPLVLPVSASALPDVTSRYKQEFVLL